MAVENKQSTAIALADAGRAVNRRLAGGRLRTAQGLADVAAADDDGSTYRICRVHSSWVIKGIKVRNTAITAGSGYNVGLYEIEGGAAVRADAYASGVDMSTARTDPIDVAFENRSVANAENQVWQDANVAGVTQDPLKWYDLVLVGATVGSAAGTALVTVEYSGD